MRTSLVATLLMIVSGCATMPNESALVDRIDPLMTLHVEALVEGDEAKILSTGRNLASAWECGITPNCIP